MNAEGRRRIAARIERHRARGAEGLGHESPGGSAHLVAGRARPRWARRGGSSHAAPRSQGLALARHATRFSYGFAAAAAAMAGEKRSRVASESEALASRSGVTAASPPSPPGMRGPPQMPQTHRRFVPEPLGSTRAMALQCGQRFASPLGVPQRPQTPPSTAAAPQAEHVARGSVTPRTVPFRRPPVFRVGTSAYPWWGTSRSEPPRDLTRGSSQPLPRRGPPVPLTRSARELPQRESALRADRRAQRTPFLGDQPAIERASDLTSGSSQPHAPQA